jgi:hypothetical protein
MIALPRSLHEQSLVHGRLGCGAALMTALTAYGVAVAFPVLGPSSRNAVAARTCGQSQRNVRLVRTAATRPHAATIARLAR